MMPLFTDKYINIVSAFRYFVHREKDVCSIVIVKDAININFDCGFKFHTELQYFIATI